MGLERGIRRPSRHLHGRKQEQGTVSDARPSQHAGSHTATIQRTHKYQHQHLKRVRQGKLRGKSGLLVQSTFAACPARTLRRPPPLIPTGEDRNKRANLSSKTPKTRPCTIHKLYALPFPHPPLPLQIFYKRHILLTNIFPRPHRPLLRLSPTPYPPPASARTSSLPRRLALVCSTISIVCSTISPDGAAPQVAHMAYHNVDYSVHMQKSQQQHHRVRHGQEQ